MQSRLNVTRRRFVQGAAAVAVAPAIARSQAVNSEIGIGVIGVGIRGLPLLQALKDLQGARLVGISDICDHYIDRVRPDLPSADTPVHREYQALLAQRDLDAVIIASPDFWHAQMAMDAMRAGKDVYIEKPMTWSLSEARQVRQTAHETQRVVQVGYQRRTMPHFDEAKEIIDSGILGQITQIQTWSSRNRSNVNPWRAYNDYGNPGLPEKSSAEHVNWDIFQANRPPRAYDPKLFFHWQCYEEYSTGVFGILMSHPVDAANMLLGLGIPDSCCANGGIYSYPDGRTVPDTCNALFNFPRNRLTVTFISSSNSAFYDSDSVYRGTEGTLDLGVPYLRIYAERKNKLFGRYIQPDASWSNSDLQSKPIFEKRIENAWSTPPHIKNFLDNVRSRGQCRAHVDAGFEAMACVAMAIESYKTGRTCHWDPKQEDFTV